jgi:hypothetical protein
VSKTTFCSRAKLPRNLSFGGAACSCTWLPLARLDACRLPIHFAGFVRPDFRIVALPNCSPKVASFGDFTEAKERAPERKSEFDNTNVH